MFRIDKRIEEYIEVCASRQAAYLGEHVGRWCDRLTPIEMLLWIAFADWDWWFRVQNRCIVCPQYKVGEYRIDFAVIHEPSGTLIAIELDGHDFHEKTKEQVAADKKRERDIVSKGWVVLRFSGSEVWRDPDLCINELQKYIETLKGKEPIALD